MFLYLVWVYIGFLSRLAPSSSNRLANVVLSPFPSGVFFTLVSASIVGMLNHGYDGRVELFIDITFYNIIKGGDICVDYLLSSELIEQRTDFLRPQKICRAAKL